MSNKMYPIPSERLRLHKHSEEVSFIQRNSLKQIQKSAYNEIINDYTSKRFPSHLKLEREVEELRKVINVQNSRLHMLEQSLEEVQPKIVVLEEMSKEEGKERVEDYFKKHGTADIEELMLNLRISVQSIVEIIDELQKEGKLSPKGE